MAGGDHAARAPRAGRGRYAWQDGHHLHAGLDPGARGLAARVSGGRRALELRHLRKAGGRPLFRHRGRRVRHGAVRQAQQVPALPPAHGHPQQPRVRPRRHLCRPGRHRDAVPPSGAYRARQRAPGGQRPRRGAATRAATRLLEQRAAIRHQARGARRPVRARRTARLRRAARQPEDRPRGLGPDGRAQPDERAGRHWRSRARWRGARAGCGGPGELSQCTPAPGVARRGGRHPHLRRLRPPPHGHADHRQRVAPQGGAAAHPGGVRATFQHHEDRHHEGPAALGAGRSRSELLPARPLRLERTRRTGPAGPVGRGGRLGGCPGGASQEGGAAR